MARAAGLPKMNKRLLASVVPGLIGLVASAAIAVPAHVDSLRGDVQKRAIGALTWKAVTPGEKVEEGSSIKTGTDSEADILTEQGHHFTIRSETTIEFTSLQPDETKTQLQSGRVLSKVH